MSETLARALAAPSPAAQPMGNQDMLARILMGNPDPGLPQYPGMEQAAPLAPTMRTGLNNDMWRSARIAEALRNDVNELFAARDPSRNYGTILPISSDPNAEGSTRFDLKGGLTGDLLAMLGAGGRAMRGEEYNPMDITTGMMTAAAPSFASRSSGALHSAGSSARDRIRAYHGGAPDLNKLSLSAATNPRERAIFATNNFDDAERFGIPYEVKIDPSQMGSYRWREFSDDPIYDPDTMAKVLQKARDEGRAGAIIQGVQNFEYGNPSTTYAVFDDSLIDILRRYGLAGMLTGGAASQAQAGEPAP